MDKELFKKTEGKLYCYYRYKKQIQRMYREVEILEKQISEIEEDIKNTNVKINYYQNGIEISERVQSSSKGTSFAESEICRAIEKLEKESTLKTKVILKKKAKIREREKFISLMDTNIEMLKKEDKRFVEYFYGSNKKIPYIAMQLNLAIATCYRHREELVENIADSMWMYK